MKPENWISLAVGIWAVIALFIGPKLAVRNSLKQFRTQKWWERQTDVYNQTLENLAVLAHYYDSEYERQKNPIFMPGAHQLVSQQVEAAMAKLYQFAATGPYYLSKPASEKLVGCLTLLNIDYGYEDTNLWKTRSETVSDCLTIVRMEAEKQRALA